MTERNKYNNLWADKLQEVSLPDPGEAWMSMELILDKEMPLVRAKDRRRWLLLILLLLLLIGVCNCPGTGRWFDSIRTGSPASTASVPSHVPSTTAPAPSTDPVAPVTVPAAAGPSTAAPAVPSTATSTVTPPQTHPVLPTSSSATSTNPNITITIPVSNPSASGQEKRRKRPAPGTRVAGKTTTFSPGPNQSIPGVDHPVTGGDGSTPVIQKTKGRRPVNSAAQANRPPAINATHTNGRPADTSTQANRPPADTGTHVNRPPAKSDTLVAKHPAPVRKDSARKKPATPPEDSTETVKGWMAGIGLNQFFPIGGQTASNYNSSGISGTLSDYIPIPMVRYYFSKKLFVQLEAQFNTPQYTKSNLTVANTIPDTGTVTVRTVTSVVSLKKLFYFNLPLSVHYNFSDHFAFGAGLQFSRLTNAVGFFDNNVLTPGGPDSASTETKSFKGDSIYQRIKTDEFRFLVDFGYTWEHFIVGLRYNQALTKFVDIQIKPGQITQGRNSSLQLYLRYILWDGRKKKLSVK